MSMTHCPHCHHLQIEIDHCGEQRQLPVLFAMRLSKSLIEGGRAEIAETNSTRPRRKS
jgi:hypothetical protein